MPAFGDLDVGNLFRFLRSHFIVALAYELGTVLRLVVKSVEHLEVLHAILNSFDDGHPKLVLVGAPLRNQVPPSVVVLLKCCKAGAGQVGLLGVLREDSRVSRQSFLEVEVDVKLVYLAGIVRGPLLPVLVVS